MDSLEDGSERSTEIKDGIIEAVRAIQHVIDSSKETIDNHRGWIIDFPSSGLQESQLLQPDSSPTSTHPVLELITTPPSILNRADIHVWQDDCNSQINQIKSQLSNDFSQRLSDASKQAAGSISQAMSASSTSKGSADSANAALSSVKSSASIMSMSVLSSASSAISLAMSSASESVAVSVSSIHSYHSDADSRLTMF